MPCYLTDKENFYEPFYNIRKNYAPRLKKIYLPEGFSAECCNLLTDCFDVGYASEDLFLSIYDYEKEMEEMGLMAFEDYRMVFFNTKVSYIVQRANITFRFNNENAPCDVFLVDNSDGNTLITKPPYNPQIKGATFAGWYKEPECINAWDFENDLTPELEYDGDGKLVFKETKLYAKWI